MQPSYHIQPLKSENKGHQWIFIVNPMAGNGKVRRQWPKMERSLRQAGISFKVAFTAFKMHAAQLAEQAVSLGWRNIVAVGGDGTANEVINGIFLQKICPTSEITFTVLPVGTGNDWIKTHRIPKKFNRWLHCFKHGKIILHDVGWLTYFSAGTQMKRYFVNVAGLSYDGYVAQQSETRKSFSSNALLYLFLILRCLFQFTIPRSKVEFNGQTKTDYFYTINVGICRYSGGGLQLVPQADPGSGRLALTLIRQVSKPAVLLAIPLFYLGKIGTHPAANLCSCSSVYIHPMDEQPVLAEADGELLGEAPARFGILPHSLRVLIPAE